MFTRVIVKATDKMRFEIMGSREINGLMYNNQSINQLRSGYHRQNIGYKNPVYPVNFIN
jgi:hypothetical protein